MHHINKHKNKFLIVASCFLATILSFSNAPASRAIQSFSDFTADGSTLILDELDPDDDRIVTVTLKAAHEMYLKNISGSFTPTDEDDEELELKPIWGIKSFGMRSFCSWTESGRFEWNTEDCHSAYAGYESDLHLQAGDPIFEAKYIVKPGVQFAERSLPVFIETATITEESERVAINISMSADVYIIPATEFYFINVHKEGNGDVIAPEVALPNKDTKIDVIPDENNELLYLEINEQDVTDQVVDNKITVNATENLNLLAIFQPVYKVTEGDGSEYIQGSEEDLSFKIDADLDEFSNETFILIDGKRFDPSMIIVDVENSTITLPADSLAMLDLGEHKLEAVFPYPEGGVARASFSIVEQQAEDEDDDEEEENPIVVPNTGTSFTKKDETEALDTVTPSVVVSMLLVASLLLARHVKNLKRI